IDEHDLMNVVEKRSDRRKSWLAQTWTKIDHAALPPTVISDETWGRIPRQWVPVIPFLPSLRCRRSTDRVETGIQFLPSALLQHAMFHHLGRLNDNRRCHRC